MTSARTAAWYFDYAPLSTRSEDSGAPDCDLILATPDDVDPAQVVRILGTLVPDANVTPLFSGHPIFWTRIESSLPIDRAVLSHLLVTSGVPVRYIASARFSSQMLPAPPAWGEARPRRATDWRVRGVRPVPERDSPWRWFLREEGVNLSRAACGTGAGTRLAIIDNDGRDLEKVQLDAEVLVNVASVPRAAAHAAMLIGWAVGADPDPGVNFRGVAPDASVRMYCIPKAVDEVFSLPLAIVRAVEDGADVIVCATYVESQASPLLDDALEFAVRVGRVGRGTALVFPTGREMSSPPGATHSSLSLGLAEPASDPRVFCIAPSARDGTWFLWRDRHGKLRPFANRGPAIRWLAPGDDMAYPFAPDDRPGHAESSGAAGIAAGVLLLVMACNPELDLAELEDVLTASASRIDGVRQTSDTSVGDHRDLMPLGLDADGHNAKHGYGRLNATSACLCARDPIARALVLIGETESALRYLEDLAGDRANAPYSSATARWAARAMLTSARLTHTAATIARALRLACSHPERARGQPPGHLLRHVCLFVRFLLDADPGLVVASELQHLERRLRDILGSAAAREVEAGLIGEASRVFDSGMHADSPAPSVKRLLAPEPVLFTERAVRVRT
jgi:hypothetical protein